MPGSRFPTVLLLLAAVLLAGCRVSAPIHFWQPPQLESTVGKSVAVAKLAGPQRWADSVEDQLIRSVPSDAGRATRLIDFEALQASSPIQLVSADDSQPNDVALASLARRDSIDYVLQGTILEDRSRVGTDQPPLTVSWRLTAPLQQRSVGGRPVVVDLDSAKQRYPDLALLNDPDSIMVQAAARETFRLITPWLDRERVPLAIPYFLPGSREVRRGCAAAHAGRWSEAAEIWREIIEKHPTQIAALHNLAVAAAAAQDFTTAKQLARKAVRLQPTKLHKQTLVWIELKQRDYHAAFDLPDPPEGWFVTHD